MTKREHDVNNALNRSPHIIGNIRVEVNLHDSTEELQPTGQLQDARHFLELRKASGHKRFRPEKVSRATRSP